MYDQHLMSQSTSSSSACLSNGQLTTTGTSGTPVASVRQYFIDLVNSDPIVDLKLLEATKLLMMVRAIELHSAKGILLIDYN